MFIRQFEYLIALDEFQHFGRAAQYCNVSQPGLSNAIKQLEMELGLPIVVRNQRFQGFTAEGKQVVKWSKRLVADRNAMLDELSVMQRNLSGRLRIGAMPATSPILPFITGRFAALHPEIRIDIGFLGISDLRNKLTDFEIDVALIYLDEKKSPDLEGDALYSEHFCVLFPAAMPLPDTDSLTWLDVAKVPLCLLQRHMYERQIIDEAFRVAGAVVVPKVEADSMVNLAFHVLHGGVATIIPETFRTMIGYFPGVVMKRLVAPVVQREIGLIWVAGEPMMPMTRAIRGLSIAMKVSGELDRITNLGKPGPRGPGCF